MRLLNWILLFGPLLCGCSNPYRTHFVPSAGASYGPVQQVDLRRVDAAAFDAADPRQALELGRVDFAGRFAAPEQAREFAAEIGANKVLLNIEYEQTQAQAANFPQTAFYLYTGPARQRLCRHGRRYGRCRCSDWGYHTYSPAYDYETLPVSIYRHRALFLREGGPAPTPAGERQTSARSTHGDPSCGP